MTLTNITGQAVTVATVQASCSCTTTATGDLEGKSIAPGESASFEATLAGVEALGPKRTRIKLVVGGYPPVDIELRAETSEAIRAVPSMILPPPLGPGEGRIVIESLDRQPFTVLSSDRRVPCFLGFDPKRSGPESLYVLRTDLGSLPPDRWPALWLIETDRADCPVIAVRLREKSLSVPGVIRLPHYELGLGAFLPGETREVSLLVNEELPASASVEGGEPCAVRALGSERAGDHWRLRIEVTAPKRATGAFLSEIRLKVGDRVQRLPVFGTVRGESTSDAPPADER